MPDNPSAGHVLRLQVTDRPAVDQSRLCSNNFMYATQSIESLSQEIFSLSDNDTYVQRFSRLQLLVHLIVFKQGCPHRVVLVHLLLFPVLLHPIATACPEGD